MAFAVSVLFSEPKIPQYPAHDTLLAAQVSFSALQRAENSSMRETRTRAGEPIFVSVLFSEPKIPQSFAIFAVYQEIDRFSALQRAENSSI